VSATDNYFAKIEIKAPVVLMNLSRWCSRSYSIEVKPSKVCCTKVREQKTRRHLGKDGATRGYRQIGKR